MQKNLNRPVEISKISLIISGVFNHRFEGNESRGGATGTLSIRTQFIIPRFVINYKRAADFEMGELRCYPRQGPIVSNNGN